MKAKSFIVKKNPTLAAITVCVAIAAIAVIVFAGTNVAHASGFLDLFSNNQGQDAENKITMIDSLDDDPQKENLVCYYDFDFENKSATVIPDKSGNQNNGLLQWEDGGESRAIKDVNIFGNNRKAIEINKEWGSTRVTLPTSSFSKIATGSGLTASAWVNIYSNSQNYARIFDFGTGYTNYLYTLTNGQSSRFSGYSAAISINGSGAEKGMSNPYDISKDTWVFATVTVDNEGKLKLYANGDPIADEAVQTDTTAAALASAILAQGELSEWTNCYLGASNYNDPATSGMFTEFKLYKCALTDHEVKQLYDVTDTEIAKADADAIDLGDISSIEKDFYLPAEGVSGSEITWTSNNSAIKIADTAEYDYETGHWYYYATVTRPSYAAGDVIVNLSATVKYNSAITCREFSATVHRMSPDEEVVESELTAVLGALTGVIMEGESLIKVNTEGFGSTFVFTSDTENVEIVDNTAQIVTRPDEGNQIINAKLHCVATFNDASRSGYVNIQIHPYDTKRCVDTDKTSTLVKVADVVEGRFPQLPNYWDVIFKDGSSAKVKTVWDYDNEKALTSEQAAGISGKLCGYDFDIKAVNDSSANQSPTASASNFDLSDIDLTGDNFLTDNTERDLECLKIMGEYKVDPNRGNAHVMRMLYNFYITGKIYTEDELATLGVESLGGWDNPHGLLRGHSTGHYLSALAQAYASTKDQEILNILTDMLSEMVLIQNQTVVSEGTQPTAADFMPKKYIEAGIDDPYLDNPENKWILNASYLTSNWTYEPKKFGKGYIGAYPPDQLVLVEMGGQYNQENEGIWAPYYTMHKILAGFLDAYSDLPDCQAKNNALQLAEGLGGWASQRMKQIHDDPNGGDRIFTRMWTTYIAGEYGGMNEVLAKLYGITHEEIYKTGSQCFDNNTLFGAMYKNQDGETRGAASEQYPGGIRNIHANQHIPPILGSLIEYVNGIRKDNTDDDYYYTIAKNFWQLATGHYAYSIGGVGRGEHFKDPYALAANIDSSDDNNNCETCCAYNLLKLTMQLNNFDPNNAEYMDYYERTLYNQIFASQCSYSNEYMHNGTTYFLPIGPGATRNFGDDWNSFSCCNGTGMENHVKYQEATYFHSIDNKTLYVGLYLPTNLNWFERGLNVTQEINFPSDTSTIKVTGEGSGTFDLQLRVPYWATSGFNVTVNGQKIDTSSAKLCSYFNVTGIKSGDTIVVNTPWDFHIDYTSDKLDGQNVGSLMYGPFVMCAQTADRHLKTLFFTNNISQSVELAGTDKRGLPIVKTNGLTFYAMTSDVLSNEAYSAYSKIFVDGIDNDQNNGGSDSSIVSNSEGDWFYALSSALDPINPNPPTPVPDPDPEYVDVSVAGTSSTGDNSALIMVVAAFVAASSVGILKFSKRKLNK